MSRIESRNFKATCLGERTESVWAPYKWPLFATMPIGLGITVAQYIAEIGRLLGAAPEQTEARA